MYNILYTLNTRHCLLYFTYLYTQIQIRMIQIYTQTPDAQPATLYVCIYLTLILFAKHLFYLLLYIRQSSVCVRVYICTVYVCIYVCDLPIYMNTDMYNPDTYINTCWYSCQCFARVAAREALASSRAKSPSTTGIRS